MADKIGGAGGIAQYYRDMGDGSYAAVGAIGAVTAAPLQLGIACVVINCTPVNTDVAEVGAIPDTTRYLAVHSSADAVIAIGAATSATVGIGVGAGLTIFPVKLGDGNAATKTLHAQSPTDNTKIRVSYLTE